MAWLALTAAAVAANLAVRNPLWAWYAFCGLIASAIIVWLDRRLGWNVPDRIYWWAGVPLALHYLGGSLSGLHSIGGPNGLYFVFPWWDNVVHFLGAAVVAVLASWRLEHAAPTWSRAGRIFVAVTVAAFFGAVVELYEFVNFVWFGTIDQGFYTNSMLDLYYNVLGATVAAWAFTRPRRPGSLATS